MKGYQLKITIKGSSPPIWRRVIVPEKISFEDLDNVIEYIFGWTHDHLLEFILMVLRKPEMKRPYRKGLTSGFMRRLRLFIHMILEMTGSIPYWWKKSWIMISVIPR